MPETLIHPLVRSILGCVALFGIGAQSVDAWAQMGQGAPYPQGPASNPMCPRLEAQLATIDRGSGSGDPPRDEQTRPSQAPPPKQKGELARVPLRAKRMGCDSSAFFPLFSGPSAQCGPVNNQIQQIRANLD